MDGRAPQIKLPDGRSVKMDRTTRRVLDELDAEGVDDFSKSNQDLESVETFREIKLQQLGQILRENVDRKYAISISKGCKLIVESIILAILMISVVLKANIYSFAYLLLAIRYMTCKYKEAILVRIVQYMSGLFLIQYLLYWLNLSSLTSLQKFPEYLNGTDYADSLAFDYIHDNYLQCTVEDSSICIMLGLGLQRSQLTNLIYDFVSLYIASMYIYYFGNPLFTVKKIFWSFPSAHDEP
jgi:hypothetical protein